MRFVNRFLSLLLLLACSLVGRAASPAYNTSTGVVSPTQFLKLDAAELKVMGVDVLTSVPAATTIYNGNGSLSADRSVNAAGNTLSITNLDFLTFNFSPTGDTIANVKTGGTNVIIFDKKGGLGIGPYFEYWMGSTPDGSVGTVVNGQDGWGETGSSIFSEYFDEVGMIYRSVYLNASANQASIKIFDDGGLKLQLDPTIGDGSTPHIFNTSITHSSGNLVEVKNHTTNVFTIDYLGNITANNINIPGDQTANNLTITNVLTVKGSAKIDTLIVTNNITVQSGTITIGGNTVATYAGITNTLTFALSDMTTALTTGTNKNYWYAPAEGMTIKWVRATLATASSSGTPTFDVNEAGTTILSTKITIDQDEWDSLNAATPPVISDSSIAGKAKVDFDIDVAGTGAAGAQIQVGYTVP